MAVEKVVRYKAVCGKCGIELEEYVNQYQAYASAVSRGWHVRRAFNNLGELIAECTCHDCLQEK